jgi:hypothetical protein
MLLLNRLRPGLDAGATGTPLVGTRRSYARAPLVRRGSTRSTSTGTCAATRAAARAWSTCATAARAPGPSSSSAATPASSTCTAATTTALRPSRRRGGY